MDEPWQTDVVPVILPGWEGIVVTVTLNVWAALVPQEFEAVTEIAPPVAPAVALIDLDVELPLYPGGNVHA